MNTSEPKSFCIVYFCWKLLADFEFYQGLSSLSLKVKQGSIQRTAAVLLFLSFIIHNTCLNQSVPLISTAATQKPICSAKTQNVNMSNGWPHHLSRGSSGLHNLLYRYLHTISRLCFLLKKSRRLGDNNRNRGARTRGLHTTQWLL